MRVTAARLLGHGQPLRVEEVDLVEPGPGEVLVDLAFGGVNPVDRYGAMGRVAPRGPIPRTLGTEGAGRIDGRPVMVYGHGIGTTRDGLWASAAVVPSEAVIDVPAGVDLERAAAMGVAGVTAWRTVVEKARVTADDRVLVLGASGGVGAIVVSVAGAVGAAVWGQTGNPEKADWVRARGAEHVVVGDAGAVKEQLGDWRPTVVFDALGGDFFASAVEVAAPQGRLVIFGTSAGAEGMVPLQQLYRKGLTVFGYAGLISRSDELARSIREGLDALAEGRMEIPIDTVLPLTEVNEAFARIEQRRVNGKLLLDLGS